MAVAAIAGDIRVIEVRRRPRHRRMAIVAVVAASDMRWVFADSNDTVMTGATGANYLRVINVESWYPGIRRMTVFAHVAGLNMCGVLARSVCAVMTARTVTRDV